MRLWRPGPTAEMGGRSRRLTSLLLLAFIAVGCSPRVVDGWALGGATGCADTPFGGDNTGPCAVQLAEIVRIATAALDRRDPGHPAITGTEINTLATPRAAGGTGATVVVVFDIAGRSSSAIGVGHEVPAPGQEGDADWVAFDYGPMAPGGHPG